MTESFYVSSDIEGMSGYGHAGAGAIADNDLMRAHMTAVAEGLRDGGAEGVTLTSFHGIPEGLPEFVRSIRTRRPDEFDLPEFTGDYAGLVMLGFHGTRPGWSFGHSYKYNCLFLNGRQCGEVTVQMLLAADKGVPTVLMVGDMGGVTEALAVAPDMLTAVTRPAKAGDEGPLDSVVMAAIRKTAADAVGRSRTIRPPAIPAKLTLGIPFRTDLPADLAMKLPYPVTRDGLIVMREATNVPEMYRFLLDSFECVYAARKLDPAGKH